METQTNHNPPDAWDQNDAGGDGQSNPVNETADALSSLNVNATPFIPGQNVFAKEFVMPPSAPGKNTKNHLCLKVKSVFLWSDSVKFSEIRVDFKSE